MYLCSYEDKLNTLLALTGVSYIGIIDNIKELDLAIEWVKNGDKLEDFYLLEKNCCDLKLAFEVIKIMKILNMNKRSV